jgi:hypothetical protein
MNVNGAAHDEHKEAFLTELASFWSDNREPMLVGVILTSYKNKTFHPKIFNTLIHINELREIYILGGQYTWSNNHESSTLEKLDRYSCLVSGNPYFQLCRCTSPLESVQTIIP